MNKEVLILHKFARDRRVFSNLESKQQFLNQVNLTMSSPTDERLQALEKTVRQKELFASVDAWLTAATLFKNVVCKKQFDELIKEYNSSDQIERIHLRAKVRKILVLGIDPQDQNDLRITALYQAQERFLKKTQLVIKPITLR